MSIRCYYWTFLTVALIVQLFSHDLFSDDWPCWRHDALRTASTDQVLEDDFHLQWSRHLPPPKAAWPEDPRLMFDASYEPIVVGQSLYLASAQTNSVTAFDTRTGNQKWRFYAGGPVRFAPVAYKGRLYFGCDNGTMYCLDVGTGSVLWEIDAAPTQRKVLGNDRLISVWPVRGGPVIKNEKLYFTSGVWPVEGNFLFAVDLKSEFIPPSFETITLPPKMLPQGYLAANDDSILIPGGRGKVRRFDVASRMLQDINYDSRAKTDYHVTASGRWMFHGDKVVDLEANSAVPFALTKPVTSGSILYGSIKSRIVGSIDLTKPVISETKNKKGELVKTVKFDAYAWKPELDGASVDPKNELPVTIALKAGERLYGFKDRTVFSCGLPGPDNKEAHQVYWSRTIDGHPSSMIAADGRLFVTTQEGQLLCFGPGQVESVRHDLPANQITATDQAKTAKRLLDSVDAAGYCLVLGLEDGKLVKELVRQTELQILVLDLDASRINSLRSELTDANVYGSRVAAFVGDPLTFSFPPYIANLIVSENWSRVGLDRGAPLIGAIYGALRPYGGAACFDLAENENVNLERWSADLSRSDLKQSDHLSILTRVGALEGAGTWSDEYGSPANTLMSGEQRVKAPLGILWFGGPASHPSLFYDRHQWASSAIIVHGRMLIQGPNKLTAVDVYTGRILWQIPLKSGLSPGRRAAWQSTGFHFLATDDLIYLVYEKACQVFDASDGSKLQEFKLPDPEQSFGRIRIWRDWLIVPAFTSDLPGHDPIPSELIAMNRHDGEVIWKIHSEMSFPFVALGEERLFVFEGLLAKLYLNRERKGRVPDAGNERYLAAYDLLSGERLWRQPTERVVTWLAYSKEKDVVIASDILGVEAWHGSGGTLLWNKEAPGVGFRGHPENLWDKVILWHDRIIDQRGPGRSYDIQTGESILDSHPLTGNPVEWEFTKVGHHCNYAIASEHLMTFRADSAAYLDLSTGGTSHLQGFRAGCRNSLIPADGILNAPNFANGCICSYSLFTSLALINVPEAEQWSYSAFKKPVDAVNRVGINLGAPGDRRDANGTLWLDYPSVGGLSPDIKVKAEGKNLRWFRQHTSKVKSDELGWVGSSGVEGIEKLFIELGKADGTANRNYNVRMLFLEPKEMKDGQRVFSVSVDDEVKISNLDIAGEAGGSWRQLVKQFDVVATGANLAFSFEASVGQSVLSGIEIIEK